MKKRALVLGGGGPVGIAWESGLIAGLAESGLDLSKADLIIGTSAGSVVGAQLAAGRAPAEMAAPFLRTEDGPSSPSQALSAPPDLTPLIGKMMESFARVRPTDEVCCEIGAWALQSQTMTEEVFIASMGRALNSLPDDFWSDRFLCTAVDTETGEFVKWEKSSGVPLRLAVSSSCAVPGIFPPVTIRGRRYMDGGMRSPSSADLATGFDEVLIVAIASSAAPEVFRRPLELEMQALRGSGSHVDLVRPDAESIAAFGPNLMDYRKRPAAAENGLRQGRAGLAAVASAWS